MDKYKDYVVVGHFAQDTIIQTQSNITSHSLGGGVTYGSLAISFFNPNVNVGIVSKIGTSFDQSLFKIFQNHNIDLSGVKQQGSKSTEYQLTYYPNKRELKLLSKAPKIKIIDFPSDFLKTRVIHLTPIANEFSLDFFSDLFYQGIRQNVVYGLDIQGLVRGFDNKGNIFLKNDSKTQKNIYKILEFYGPHLFLKASDQEAFALTGISDIAGSVDYLADLGVNVLITLGKEGSVFKCKNSPISTINAYTPNQVVDETGAGDCFFAIFLNQVAEIQNINSDWKKYILPIKRASAAASFLIEKKGPDGFASANAIEDRIINGKEIIK